MADAKTVASLFYDLERRFMFVGLCWCIGIEREARDLGPLPKGKKHPEDLQAHASRRYQRIMREFLFAWLLEIEYLSREFDRGIVRKERFDDAMLWGGGQLLYDLFASKVIRGPYALPWDNTQRFREGVLRPAARLMREYEKNDALLIPPEAKVLLELRGLTFNF